MSKSHTFIIDHISQATIGCARGKGRDVLNIVSDITLQKLCLFVQIIKVVVILNRFYQCACLFK